jgi:integrin beta 8
MTFMDDYADAASWQPPQITQPTAPVYQPSWTSGEPSLYEEDPGAPIFPGNPGGGGPALPPVTAPTEDTILGGPPTVLDQGTTPPVVAPPVTPQPPMGGGAGGSRSYAVPSRYSEQAAAHQARIRAMIGGGAARGGPVRMQGGGRIPQRPGGLGQVAQRPRAPGVGTRPPMPPGGQPPGPGGPGGVGMRGGAPPSMRGHLQAMRAQQRQAQGGGGNRIGMGDQQGGLARAMQTQTGRPPISRRAAFPGSRQNQY